MLLCLAWSNSNVGSIRWEARAKGPIGEIRGIPDTDDAGNDESLTSAATAPVERAGDAEPPAKPTGLSGTATHDRVALTWDDPQDDSITGYVILRRIRENDEGGEFSELVANTGSAAASYTDDTVAAGITYTYRIKAINRHGVSERSRWLHIDTPEAPAPDTPPERDNSPATGSPTINGTAQVGETLKADTSGIADADGLETRLSPTSGWETARRFRTRRPTPTPWPIAMKARPSGCG